MTIRCPGCGKEKNIGEGKYKCKSCKIKFQLKDNSLIVKDLSEHNAYIDSIINEVEDRYSFNKVLSYSGITLCLLLFFIPFTLKLFFDEIPKIPVIMMGMLSLLAYIGTVVTNYITWKCPACDKYLSHGRNLLIYPVKCGSCGITIKRGEG